MAMQSYEERRKQRPRKRLFGFLLAPKLRGFVRVALYLTLVCFVLGIFAARSAMGGVSEQALVVGRQLSKLEDLTESSNRLVINGEQINLASAVTSEPLDKVLDRFEALCRSEGVVSQEFSRLDKVLKDKVPEPKTAIDFGILRKESGHDGMVACIVEEPGNKRSAFKSLERFMESQDLKDVGLLRYAYARKTERGNTHVLTAWTDGSFKLSAMIPEADGTDTAGTDPAGAIRPPKSQRLLSASVQGAPHAVRIYESSSSPNDVLAAYEREMPKLGWEPIKGASYDVPEARYYSKGGVDLLVVADENGERTAVSMVETRSR